MEKYADMIEKIEQMTVIELHEFVKFLEEKWGVSAAAAVVAGPAVAADAAEEKTSFDVVLEDAGEQKIAVMKVVKEQLALGLKEAKELVDGAPAPVKQGLAKAEAEALKKALEEAGAKVSLK